MAQTEKQGPHPNAANKTEMPNGQARTDTFDIEQLWIDDGLKDPLATEHFHDIPIGRPRDFFRTVRDPSFRHEAEIVSIKSENVVGEQFYLVGPTVRGLIEEARPCIIIVTVDRTWSPRLWPLKRPRPGERDNAAWISSRAIARSGLDYWVKALWQGRSFVERRAEAGYAPDPDFSKLPPLNALIRLAFGDNGIIQDETHPVYRDLFGKAQLPGGDDPLS
jgi:hypothetical protein